MALTATGAMKEDVRQMLGNTAGVNEVRVRTRSIAARPKMRKPWEFTWDDASAAPALASAIMPPAKLPSEARQNVTSIADAGVPRRMRRAWEFTWDDEAGTTATRGRSAPVRGVSDAPVPAVDESPANPPGAAESSAAASHDEDLSVRPRRRRRKAGAVRQSASVDPVGAVTLEPTAPEPIESSDEPTSASTNVNDVDLDGVLRRLEAMGGVEETAPRRKDNERVEWVRARRTGRPVQVVHIGQQQKSHATAKASLGVAEESPALRSDPLVLRAIRLAELLRVSTDEAENLSEIRKAVRDMRTAMAGVEAKAFSGRKTQRVPSFFQAYDRRTRTG